MLPEFLEELPLSDLRLCGAVVGLEVLDLSVVVGLATVPWFVVCPRLLVAVPRVCVALPASILPLLTSLPVLLRVVAEPLSPLLSPRDVPTRLEVVVPSVPLRLDAVDLVSIRPLASRTTPVEPRLVEVEPASLRLEVAVLVLNLSRLVERTEELAGRLLP